MDASFATTREGTFLRALVSAYEALDEDAFTDVRLHRRVLPASPYSLRPTAYVLACTSRARPVPVPCTDAHHALGKARERGGGARGSQVVREYDEVSRLDVQKTSLLLEIKKKMKDSTEDIT